MKRTTSRHLNYRSVCSVTFMPLAFKCSTISSSVMACLPFYFRIVYTRVKAYSIVNNPLRKPFSSFLAASFRALRSVFRIADPESCGGGRPSEA